MGPIASSVATGAAGGAIATKLLEKIHDIFEEEEEWEKLLHHFPREWDYVWEGIKALAEHQARTTKILPITLYPDPGTYLIDRKGYPYFGIFTLTAIDLSVFVMGIGSYTPTTRIGMNNLLYPNASTLALKAGATGTQNVLGIWSDTALGDTL